MTLPVAFVMPSFAGGGAERVMLTFAGHLDRTRFAPTLVVLDAAGPLRDSVSGDLPVVSLGARRLRRAVGRLCRTLRRLRPAAIVATPGYVSLAVLALRPWLPPGVRILAREANLPSAALATVPAPALFRAAYRGLYPRADRILCPARAVAEELARDFGLPSRRIVLLRNPVDEDRLRAAAPEREPGPGRRFVAAGRLVPQKGFDRLIADFAGLPADDRLTILGEGPEREALAARIAEGGLGDRVRLAGFRPAPAALYAGADAFLLPSRWEGMPNAALEALAVGTPVIATPEAGGIAEVAEAAPDGAVALAESGAPFAAAMRAVRPAPAGRTRPSLLPEPFRLARAVGRLEDLLTGSGAPS